MLNVTLGSREQVDAQVAKQLADRIEHEEMERRLVLEQEDKEVARRLQVNVLPYKTVLLIVITVDIEDLSPMFETQPSLLR